MKFFTHFISLLVFYLLLTIYSSNVLSADDFEKENLDSGNRIVLQEYIDAFEQGQYQKAFSGFLRLREMGGTVGESYLHYIKSNNLVDMEDDCLKRVEPVPEGFLSQSKDYLDASLTIMRLYEIPGFKKKSLKEAVTKLNILAKSGNNRASLLLIRIIEDSNHKSKALSYLKIPLKEEKNFCSCLVCKMFHKYLKPVKLDVLLNNKNCEVCQYRSTLRFNPDALLDLNILRMANGYNIIPHEFFKSFSFFFLAITKKDIGTAGLCMFKITKEPVWLRFALENGCIEAMTNFPQLKSHHDDTLRYAYFVSAENGDKESQYHYADMVMRGAGGMKNLEVSRSYLEKAANKNHDPSMFRYALMLRNGEGGDKDQITARKLLTNLSKNNNPEILYHLACMLKNGEGGSQDLLQAREYMRQSAEAGNTKAESEYAFLLQGKDSAPVNLEMSREFHFRASKKGNENSTQEYAKMIREGIGGPADPEQARECYRMLANKGHKLFKHEYARMLYSGEGGDRDLPKARETFQALADEGDSCAAHQYAQMAREGEGGRVNLFDAQKYFLLGADNGNACCQFYYAQMLLEGEGIKKKNPERARKYLVMASNQGHADAVAILQELDHLKLQKTKKNKIQKTKENYAPLSSQKIEQAEPINVHKDDGAAITTYTFPYITINEDEGCSSSSSDEEFENRKTLALSSGNVFNEKTLEWIENSRNKRREKREGKVKKCTTCITHSFEKIIDDDEKNRSSTACSFHHHCDNDKKVWHVKDKNTINFVDAIFNRNGQKINLFTVSDACKAFNDLGCISGKSRVGKNKAQVIYRDEVKKVVHKYKFHDPHGHGDNRLYIALVPYTKRFLISIGLTEYCSIELQS